MKSRVLKAIAGVVAVGLICGILVVTNAFVGNPISSKIAEKAVKNYANEKYAFLDLELEKPVYNFKDGSYVVWAKSRTSIDTKFSMNYRNGEIYYDSYEFDVLRMHNTLYRLANEYSYIVREILEKELGYKDNSTRVMYNKYDYESAKYKDDLKLDMEFDRSLPLDPEVILSLKDVEDVSLESISKILIDSHETLVNNECHFTKYSLYAGDKGTLASVHGVRPDHIESGQLLNLLQEAMDYEDDIEFEKGGDKIDLEERISIFIKSAGDR